MIFKLRMISPLPSSFFFTRFMLKMNEYSEQSALTATFENICSFIMQRNIKWCDSASLHFYYSDEKNFK